MYSILFHLLWLSLLEIIFYFEYIGPLESRTYKNTIRRLVNNKNDNTHYLVNPYNVSNIININDIEFNINQAKKDRQEYNNNLYKESINYWLILLSIVLTFYSIIILYNYRNFLKRKEDISRLNNLDIEFTTVRNRSLTADTEDLSDSSELYLNTDEKFINISKIKKILLEKSIFYIFLGILILCFEYLFFNYIIIKYKVLSDEEILSEIYKIINPLLDNIFNN